MSRFVERVAGKIIADYANFQAEYAEEEISEDHPEFVAYRNPPATVPSQVSPAQAEIALYRYDDGVLLGRINALIDAYPYEPVRIWWRKATYIARDHPYLQAVALELGLSEETVDALFVTANAI